MGQKKAELPEGFPPESALPGGRIYMLIDREVVVRGLDTLHFVPGRPVAVRRDDQSKVIAHGGYALTQTPEVEGTPKGPNGHPQDPNSEDYRAEVRVAAEKLLVANQPSDFGANGKPRVDAWQRELGWKPLSEVRDAIWDEVKDEHTRDQGR